MGPGGDASSEMPEQWVLVARVVPGLSPRTQNAWESGPDQDGPASSSSLGVWVPRANLPAAGPRTTPPTPRPRGVMGSSLARPPPPASPRTLFPASWKELERCVERAGSPGPDSASETVARSQRSLALTPPGQGKECPRVAPRLGARQLGVRLEAT